MTTLQIEKERWTEYLDHLSRITDAQLIKIEVTSMQIGDQVEIEDASFDGISYDKKDDVIAVQAGSLQHMIKQPQQVYVLLEDEEDKGLSSMEITDVDETKHILSFKSSD